MNITFNPQLTRISYANYATNYKKNEQQNIKQNAITELPSFGARKPLTEDEKCQRLLKYARNPNSSFRYSNKEKKEDLMLVIKNFKTQASKSEILSSLLYCQDGVLDYFNDLRTSDIKDYFKYMSGKPAEAQLFMAKFLSADIPSGIKAKIDLLKKNQITADDFKYILENINGKTADERFVQFAAIIDLITSHPKLLKHKELLVSRANMGVSAQDNLILLRDGLKDCKLSSVIKMLRLFTPKNQKKLIPLLNSFKFADAEKTDKLIKSINQDNLSKVCTSYACRQKYN